MFQNDFHSIALGGDGIASITTSIDSRANGHLHPWPCCFAGWGGRWFWSKLDGSISVVCDVDRFLLWKKMWVLAFRPTLHPCRVISKSKRWEMKIWENDGKCYEERKEHLWQPAVQAKLASQDQLFASAQKRLYLTAVEILKMPSLFQEDSNMWRCPRHRLPWAHAGWISGTSQPRSWVCQVLSGFMTRRRWDRNGNQAEVINVSKPYARCVNLFKGATTGNIVPKTWKLM